MGQMQLTNASLNGIPCCVDLYIRQSEDSENNCEYDIQYFFHCISPIG
jgi:hypothetical protein